MFYFNRTRTHNHTHSKQGQKCHEKSEETSNVFHPSNIERKAERRFERHFESRFASKISRTLHLILANQKLRKNKHVGEPYKANSDMIGHAVNVAGRA